MVVQHKLSERERTDSVEGMFMHCIDVLRACVNELEPNELRDIYKLLSSEAEQEIDQQRASEKYESLVQKWHILHMIFSIDYPEV